MELFFDLELSRKGGQAVFLGNLNKKNTKNHFLTFDIFVKRTLLIWLKVNLTTIISFLRHYKTQRLWNISFFDKNWLQTCIDFQEWFAKGMLKVVSLIKRKTCFLSYTEFVKQISLQKLPTCF